MMEAWERAPELRAPRGRVCRRPRQRSIQVPGTGGPSPQKVPRRDLCAGNVFGPSTELLPSRSPRAESPPGKTAEPGRKRRGQVCPAAGPRPMRGWRQGGGGLAGGRTRPERPGEGASHCPLPDKRPRHSCPRGMIPGRRGTDGLRSRRPPSSTCPRRVLCTSSSGAQGVAGIPAQPRAPSSGAGFLERGQPRGSPRPVTPLWGRAGGHRPPQAARRHRRAVTRRG